MYPKMLHHAALAAKEVTDAAEEAAAKAIGYVDEYVHQEFPKVMRRGDEQRTAMSPDEEQAHAAEGFSAALAHPGQPAAQDPAPPEAPAAPPEAPAQS